MAFSRRFEPSFAPGESCLIGLDFSSIIPPGASVSRGTLAILTNTATPAPADSDFQVGTVETAGRVVYASLSGGVAGRDYQLVFTATDAEGNTFPRTALLLCAPTS